MKIDVNPIKTLQREPVKQSVSYEENIDGVLDKSVVLKPGFGRIGAVPKYEESLRAAKKLRKTVREQTAGPKWYGLNKGCVEDNIDDLEILRMRSGLGSIIGKKQYYRAADRRNLPKYFQKGTIVESAADFYSGRVPKKQRKKTLVEELLADVEVRNNQQSKYELIAAREAKRRRLSAVRNRRQAKKSNHR